MVKLQPQFDTFCEYCPQNVPVQLHSELDPAQCRYCGGRNAARVSHAVIGAIYGAVIKAIYLNGGRALGVSRLVLIAFPPAFRQYCFENVTILELTVGCHHIY
jgi:hypothetical protein